MRKKSEFTVDRICTISAFQLIAFPLSARKKAEFLYFLLFEISLTVNTREIITKREEFNSIFFLVRNRYNPM